MSITRRIYAVKPIFRWLSAIAWTVVFSILLVIPTSGLPIPPDLKGFILELFANMIHILGFMLLTILWLWTFTQHTSQINAHLMTVVLAVLFAIGTEWMQTQLPERNGSIGDLVADAIGIALGLWLFRAKFRLTNATTEAPSKP